MGTSNLPDDDAAVNFLAASDICWTLEPRAPLERVDVLSLDDWELLDYARDLQHETASVRELLHEALSLTRQLERARLRIDSLVTQLRIQRRPRKASL